MKSYFIGFLLILSGCGSVPQNQSFTAPPANLGREEVVARIDGLASRPPDIRESEPFRIENEQVYVLGMTTIPGSDSVSAAFRFAENQGKSLVASAIESRLDFTFMSAQEGTAIGQDQSRYIGLEASKLTTHALRLHKRYWERVTVVQENGQTSLQYKVYSVLVMNESDFKSAILDAIRASQGKLGLSADFSAKVSEKWSDFTGMKPTDKSEAPKAADVAASKVEAGE